VAAFSSRPAAAFALGKGYALAGAGCRERRTLHDRGWRVSGALVDAAAKLSLADVSTLQRLYDSEINFEVSGFYDAGFDVRLRDHFNGFIAKGKVETWAEAEAWLRDKALAHP
jgi:hypothetical protein